MKKVNKILIGITLFLAFITISQELDRGIVIILKDSSIILTIILPYIIKKITKIDIGDGLTFTWIIFIFLAHYLGVTCEYYNKWQYFDKLTHTVSGVLSALVAIKILKENKIKKLPFKVLFIISFTWMCAGLWEVFEYVCNILFGGDAQKVVETGVNDTMLDMIVAFIGSIIVSITHCVKEK